ncbi:MAG: CRTAC1 family protein [Gemmatimonadota bacterium]
MRALSAGMGPLFVSVFLIGCASQEEMQRSVADELHFSLATTGGVVRDAASTGGVSWADYDGDGDLDLTVTNGYDVSAAEPTPQANRIYRNDGNGGLTLADAGPVTTDEGYSSGHTWGDYDNDGDLDLFVANQEDQVNFLYRNDGGGSFTRVMEGAVAADGGHSYAAAWIDVDRDGALDLFVANGGLSHTGANFLYRNLGNDRFEKITDGAIVSDEAASCGIAWADYDNDGDSDLFVANNGFNPATNRNALYRNEGDWTFTKLTDNAVAEDRQPSSSANWMDYDNDGDLDLYVANLYGRANLLYRNDGTGELEPVTEVPITVDGGHSQSTNWEDYDSDGDLDLLIANWGSGPDLYLNDGHGYLERTRAGDVGRLIGHAATMASGDFDGDGDVDVYIGNWPDNPGPGELNSLFVNEGMGSNWLQVELVGTESNRAGIGARVSVVADVEGVSRTQIREISSQTGFRSQSSLVQHFGLGDATTVAEVMVAWPSGERSRVEGLNPNQRVTITEP